MSAATYPVYDVGDIVSYCSTWGLMLDGEHILHPTPGMTQSIFEFWMERLLGLSADTCREAAHQQLDQMENSEIYGETMYISVLHLTLNQLMQRVSVDDFTTKDLTAPTPARFQSQLSAIVNFYLFDEEQAGEYLHPMQLAGDRLAQEETDRIRESSELRAELDAMKDERLENEPKTKEQFEQLAKLGAGMIELRKISTAAGNEIDAKKAEVATIYQEVVEKTQSNKVQDIEISSLQAQVIRSPDRLRANIDDMQKMYAREVETVKALEAKEKMMGTKKAVFGKYELDIAQCNKIMDEWKLDVDKIVKAGESYDAHAADLEKILGQKQEMEININLLQRRIKNVEDDIIRFEEKQERKRTVNKQKKRSLEDQHSLLVEQKRDNDGKAIGLNKRAEKIEREMRAMAEDLHRETERGEMGFKRIKDQVVPLPTLPTIPLPGVLAAFYSHFPLVTYPAPPTSNPAPPIATLWILGTLPLSSSTSPNLFPESLHPYSRIAQTLARFSLVAVQLRWLSTEDGAFGEGLPNLHLPDGELLGREGSEMEEWLQSGTRRSTGLVDSNESAGEMSPTYEAFDSLVKSTLLPAVMALGYFSATPTKKVTHGISNNNNTNHSGNVSNTPFLSSCVAYYDSVLIRRERVKEIMKLRGGKKGGVLDLEDLEREAVETIGVLEVKLREEKRGAQAWFEGSLKPTLLDAKLYALLSIVLVQPGASASALRRKLEMSPTLLAWVKAHAP